MRVLSLTKNPSTVQKCLFPDCQFLRENSGSYGVLTRNDCKFIVRIGLCELKNVTETVFLDSSVSIFSSLETALRKIRPTDIGFDDIAMKGKPRVAKVVKVVVAFCDVFDVMKHGRSAYLPEVVKDILKLFVVSSNSSVVLSCLSNKQKFGINQLIILDVDGSKSNQVFSTCSDTIVKIEQCVSQMYIEQCYGVENQIRVGGCKRAYNVLYECINLSKCSDRGKFRHTNKVLLIGPPGSGKTTLVHNVTRDCKGILLEILPSTINILTGVEMEKKLKNYFEEAKIYAACGKCCVILIDNLDMMCSGRTSQSKRFTGQLITLLEEINDVLGVVVVATTGRPEEVDLQLRRANRLEDELEILVPTVEERIDILEKILGHCGIKLNEELLHQIAHWSPGFVGADLRLLVVEALLMANKSKGLEENLFTDCFKQALTKVVPSALKGAIGLCRTNCLYFSQIGGLNDIKKNLDMLVKQQLLHPRKFHKLGVPLTKGILLYGPPGCAKTTLVKALARECNITFLAISAADLYSPFVGEAEKKIVQLFTQARIGSPSIIFIDEIDAVVGSKSGGRERGVQERILSTLLIEMDGVGLKVTTPKDTSLHLLSNSRIKPDEEPNPGVIVIGATNRPQLLDDALKRPGRFDRLLYVPPPNDSERLRILEKLTKKMPLDESVDLEAVARATKFYSGADLKNLCQESGLHALKESGMATECIRQCHFDHALNEYKPSLNENVVSFYESFQKYNS